MAYITEEFYKENYLLGRKPTLPKSEFMYWERQARIFVDEYTFDRIKQDESLIDRYLEEIGGCLCELAEYLYMNEGYKNKVSESVPGRSATYKKGTEYQICQGHLGMTGLMYRGS